MADVMLGLADKNREVAIDAGSRLLLQLPENPSTGYRWELRDVGEEFKLESASFWPGDRPQPGAGGLRVFRFLVPARGETTVRLQLRQPWDLTSPPAETYEVTLRVAAAAE